MSDDDRGDDRQSIVWPSASTLVERAERSLNIVRPAANADRMATPLMDQLLADMELRLTRFERAHGALVPPGFESTGRFASIKRFSKKVTRRLVWWYVEPRWSVQREISADLVSFAHSSIELSRAMSVEVRELEAKIDQMQRGSRSRQA